MKKAIKKAQIVPIHKITDKKILNTANCSIIFIDLLLVELGIKMVSEAGLEPARLYRHMILSHGCLPIPPLRLFSFSIPSFLCII